jgi:hypothetical protein
MTEVLPWQEIFSGKYHESCTGSENVGLVFSEAAPEGSFYCFKKLVIPRKQAEA